MAKGFYLVQGDKTTCGGRIIEGATDHTIFGKAAAREKDRVLCGKHPGTFLIAGGIINDTIHGRRMAGTLDSESTCPCKAKFIPSMLQDTYEKASKGSAAASESSASNPVARPLPAYLTGEKVPSGFVPDYPVLINTRSFPDNYVRKILADNNSIYMLLTLEEATDVVDAWDHTKKAWVDITSSHVGNATKLYATNIYDVMSLSKVIYKLGEIGITATIYVNHKGTELVKISGYAGVRKILNAPVFSTKNPKIIEVGIGKYGLKNSIKQGAIVGFIYVSVVDTIDFILNDKTSLARFIGGLATDLVKVGLSSAVVMAVGTVFVSSFIVLNLAVVVMAGIATAYVLNLLDDELGVTNKLVNIISPYIESAQQEFAEKSREISNDILDLGAMYVAGALAEGKEVVTSEVKKYIKKSIDNIIPRRLDL
jgi:uncharacterized Zn-binding protein involved in type VI secretion